MVNNSVIHGLFIFTVVFHIWWWCFKEYWVVWPELVITWQSSITQSWDNDKNKECLNDRQRMILYHWYLLYPKRLKHVYISVSQKALAIKQSCCIKQIPTSLGNIVLKLAFLCLWNQHDKHTLWHLRKPYYNVRKWLLFYFFKNFLLLKHSSSKIEDFSTRNVH